MNQSTSTNDKTAEEKAKDRIERLHKLHVLRTSGILV